MKIQSVYSTNQNVNDAVKEIKNQIKVSEPKLIMFFASSKYNQEELAAKMKEAFNNSDVVGCSTAGELVSGKMLDNSIVAMAFAKEKIGNLKVEVIENLKNSVDPQKAFESFEKYFSEKLSNMDFKKYFGIILVDGLSNSEEKLMDKIGTKTNVNFIGGSAGDDLKFQKTFVSANGKAYSDAAVIVLVKPEAEFDILKTQSFVTTDKVFTATKVDEEKREILELDGKPAAEVYAEAINEPVENIAAGFMTYPLGVMVGDEPFVRSPQQPSGKGIRFYCNVAEGTELTLLKSEDIVADTKKDLKKKIEELGTVEGIVNFNCILRTLELKGKNQSDDYGKVFSDIPTIGFSTYGEEYIGHINQTAVMLVLK